MPWPQPRSCLNLAYSASTETLTRFLLLQQGTASTRSCSNWSCPHLALPHLTSPHLAPPHLIAYPILKSSIIPHYVKMHLVPWQLTIQYGYLAHLNQLLFNFPSCPALFNHCLVLLHSTITSFDSITSQKLSLQKGELLSWCQITCSETSLKHQYNFVEAPAH